MTTETMTCRHWASSPCELLVRDVPATHGEQAELLAEMDGLLDQWCEVAGSCQ